MGFIQELQWRGMLQDISPGVEEYLAQGSRTGYIGFDPTAPSLTIGNYVQLMILNLFQRSGHRPLALMGGATGRIGDPSGKDQERQLKSLEELEHNTARQIEQIRKFLNFEEGPNRALLFNNLDFYRDMTVLDFLRTVGKTLTINYMMSKESVRRRVDIGISFTEFSYQLLQAYDFQCLYDKYDCRVQMGGSDQWGNITSGTEFIRRNVNGKAYAVTTPLLTKADGTKFGKSEEGNIWLDPEMTTPYAFYQYWIRSGDEEIPVFYRYFSLRTKEEIQGTIEACKDDPRRLKSIFAEEITRRIHSDEAFESVLRVSRLMFSKKMDEGSVREMTVDEWKMVGREIPHKTVPIELLGNRVPLVDLLSEHTGIVASKGEARRAIRGNAISVNKKKISELEAEVDSEDLLHGAYLLIENGKKNKYLVEAK